MAVDRPEPDDVPPSAVPAAGARSSDRSPWYWLLLVPILLVAWPPLYDRDGPQLFDIPFFYWYQLAVVPVGVACTVLAYRMTNRRGPGGGR